MALDGTLKYWNNGEPVIPDGKLVTLKYWNNGEPYTIYKASVIINLFQKCNVGADLYNGGIIA